MVLGMFHNRKDPNKVSRAYLYNLIANNEGVKFYYFTSKDVDLNNKKIVGKYYQDGIWNELEINYPDVVINGANQNSKEQKRIENELKKEIPFTSYPVGSKLSIYKLMKKSKMLRKYLIPFQEVKNVEDVFSFLDIHKKIVIKPVRGHHGDDLITIEKKEDEFLLRIGAKEKLVSKQEIEKIIVGFEKKMVMQKHINCKVKSNIPYDFRIHMQKNGLGNWEITAIVPRIASSNREVTNLSRGSQMIEYKSFLFSEYGNDAYFMKRLLEVFSLSFVKRFEKLYPYHFDELGIDIGVDENKDIWLYEVNWRPGHVFLEVATAKNAINYAIFLANNHKKEGEKIKNEENVLR